MIKKYCKECEAEFTPKNQKGTFCSAKCRQKDYRKRMSDFVNYPLIALREWVVHFF